MADLSLSIGRAGLKQQSLLPLLNTLAEMYHIGQTLPKLPELAETSNMDLRTLLEVLFRTGGIEAVKEFFASHAYRVSQPCKGTPFQDTVIGVKYIDGLNNLWKPKWAREARGRFYYYDGANKKVLALKDTLQRGVEVLTHAHTKATITETQDMRQGIYDHLDETQQSCIAAFQQSDAPMDAYLTGKVDGSLVIVSVYPRETEECRIMEKILATCGDSFAQELAKACEGGPLIVVASQGTLMLGNDMQDYFITALQALLGSLPPHTSEKDAWALQAPLFVKAVREFTDAAKLSQRTHLCFEAYCKHRKSLWGRLHTELAISYDHNGFNLLGAMADNRYIPHFDLPRAVFAQPIFLHVSSTSQVFAIMEDMDQVVLGTLDREAFLARYGFPHDSVIHMEGWVFLAPVLGGYDYAKIKTPLYYKCHKVRSAEVPALLALPTSCDATYPILTVLREFHTHADRRLSETIDATITMLEAEIVLGTASAFYEALPSKARAHFVPERQDTLMRMLMNVCVDLFKSRLREILRRVWEMEAVPDEMVFLVRTVLTKHMPWINPLNADARREAMKGLYGILVESMNPA